MSVYSKISYLLLEILITKNKDKFYSESSKVIIDKKYKKSDLADIVHFLFYVKDKSSKLLYFSEESKKIFDEIKGQSNNNIDEHKNNIMYFSEFFGIKNCTYKNLVNTLIMKLHSYFFQIQKNLIKLTKLLKK